MGETVKTSICTLSTTGPISEGEFRAGCFWRVRNGRPTLSRSYLYYEIDGSESYLLTLISMINFTENKGEGKVVCLWFSILFLLSLFLLTRNKTSTRCLGVGTVRTHVSGLFDRSRIQTSRILILGCTEGIIESQESHICAVLEILRSLRSLYSFHAVMFNFVSTYLFHKVPRYMTRCFLGLSLRVFVHDN